MMSQHIIIHTHIGWCFHCVLTLSSTWWRASFSVFSAMVIIIMTPWETFMTSSSQVEQWNISKGWLSERDICFGKDQLQQDCWKNRSVWARCASDPLSACDQSVVCCLAWSFTCNDASWSITGQQEDREPYHVVPNTARGTTGVPPQEHSGSQRLYVESVFQCRFNVSAL